MRDRNLRQREYRVNKKLKEAGYFLEVSPAWKSGEAVSDLDHGGYQIRALWGREIVAGEHYTLTLEKARSFVEEHEIAMEKMQHG